MNDPEIQQAMEELTPVHLGPLPEQPLVSVLTANYNYARFIGEAIESVQKQTYANWEMIICDDGSADNSCEVAGKYVRQDRRVKLIRKENGGQASALNAAYRSSHGSIICFLDADDLYRPNKLETIVSAFRDQASSGFLAHPVTMVDQNRRPRGVYPLLQALPNGWKGPDLFHKCHLALPPCSGLSLRRSVAEGIFPVPESFRSNADGVFQVLAPLLTPAIGLQEPLSELRVHGANLTQAVHITPEYLERELANQKRLWQVQREYLARRAPSFLLVPDDQRPQALLMSYVAARLRGQPEGARIHRQMTADESFQTVHPASRLFWRCSVWLPKAVFAQAVDLMWGDGRLRRLVNSVRKPWRYFAGYAGE